MSWDDLTWEAKRGAVLSEAHFVCQMCFGAEAVEIDHIWPKSKGGQDRRDNLRAACQPCNRAKGDSILLADLQADPGLPSYGSSHYQWAATRAAFEAIRWSVFQALLLGGMRPNEADDASTLDDQAVASVIHVVSGTIDDQSDRLVDAALETAT